VSAAVQLEWSPVRIVGDCAICDEPIDDPHDERHTLASGLDVHPQCCPCDGDPEAAIADFTVATADLR